MKTWSVAALGACVLVGLAGSLLMSCEKMVPAQTPGCTSNAQCMAGNPMYPICGADGVCYREDQDLLGVGPTDGSVNFDAPMGDLAGPPDLVPMCSMSSACPLATPVCTDGGVCAHCTADNDCTDHVNAPHCNMANGSCVLCVVDADCKDLQLTCDEASNACVPCKTNSECDSGICDLSMGTGKCVLAADIAYVNNAAGTCVGAHTGSKTDPYCNIDQAITGIGTRTSVLVAASSKHYGKIVVDKKAIRFVGPGARPWLGAQPNAVIDANSDPGVMVTGAGALVVVDGFEITNSTLGVSCGGGAATLSVLRSWIHDNTLQGVASNGCTLLLDMNQVGPRNNGGGLDLSGPAITTITNNFIVGNSSTMAPGVSFANNTAIGVFQFNTVVDNSYMTTQPGGIICGTGSDRPIENSIVVSNSQDTATTSQIVGARCKLSNVVVGITDLFLGGTKLPVTFTMIGDYHLDKADANNGICCINEVGVPDGGMSSSLSNHDIDGDPRPVNALWDIGADEVK